jgi:hypothetical protein
MRPRRACRNTLTVGALPDAYWVGLLVGVERQASSRSLRITALAWEQWVLLHWKPGVGRWAERSRLSAADTAGQRWSGAGSQRQFSGCCAVVPARSEGKALDCRLALEAVRDETQAARAVSTESEDDTPELPRVDRSRIDAEAECVEQEKRLTKAEHVRRDPRWRAARAQLVEPRAFALLRGLTNPGG